MNNPTRQVNRKTRLSLMLFDLQYVSHCNTSRWCATGFGSSRRRLDLGTGLSLELCTVYRVLGIGLWALGSGERVRNVKCVRGCFASYPFCFEWLNRGVAPRSQSTLLWAIIMLLTHHHHHHHHQQQHQRQQTRIPFHVCVRVRVRVWAESVLDYNLI